MTPVPNLRRVCPAFGIGVALIVGALAGAYPAARAAQLAPADAPRAS